MQRRARAGSAARKLEHRADPGLDRLRPVLGLLEGGGDPLAQLLHHRLVGGDEALVLAREVLVEGAAGDGGGAGDVGDRRARVAMLGDRLGDPGDQALALVMGDELARQAVAPRRQARQLRRVALGIVRRRVLRFAAGLLVPHRDA